MAGRPLAVLVVGVLVAAGLMWLVAGSPESPPLTAPATTAGPSTSSVAVVESGTTTTATSIIDRVATTATDGGSEPRRTTTVPTTVAPTTATTEGPRVATMTTTTSGFAVAAPVFNAIAPAHTWPENPDRGTLAGEIRQAVEVWDRIEALWEWYLSEGHSQGHAFDASTRPELLSRAAEQLNWIHHRFWSETLPVWDRVWNEAWAAEREQQREWLMIAFGDGYVYNHPGDGVSPRYWGPLGFVADEANPGSLRRALLPLVDLDALKVWMERRGHDLDTAVPEPYADEGFTAETLAAMVSADLFDPDGGTGWGSPPILDPSMGIWEQWAESVDLEQLLGPQAAGSKMGPAEGEMWYQWYPERLDVSPIYQEYLPSIDGEAGPNWAGIFSWYPDWWPDRLEIPVHDPAQFAVGGAIAPPSPDTGTHYFEVCLWASGGLFGPWSLPHPELPEASANTTWWMSGLADPAGMILEISRPRNRPCLPSTGRPFFESNWPRIWDYTVLVEPQSSDVAGNPDVWADRGLSPEDEYAWAEHQAYLDMLGRNGLGSWLWRENPNPDSERHSWLSWEPPNQYSEAPSTVGVMIHPLYLWNPTGTPVGYPAGDIRFPWKWWPITPARDAEHPRPWRISIGGCHQPAEPYLWMEYRNTSTPGMTTDGGPVWSWPGVIESSSTRTVAWEWQREATLAFRREHRALPGKGIPDLYGYHTLSASEYHPPVPCQDIADGKYKPDAIDNTVTAGRYRSWMPAVGDRPPSDWPEPDRENRSP